MTPSLPARRPSVLLAHRRGGRVATWAVVARLRCAVRFAAGRRFTGCRAVSWFSMRRLADLVDLVVDQQLRDLAGAHFGQHRVDLGDALGAQRVGGVDDVQRSEEHTSELQSLMRISYAVFCVEKKKKRENYKNKIEYGIDRNYGSNI